MNKPPTMDYYDLPIAEHLSIATKDHGYAKVVEVLYQMLRQKSYKEQDPDYKKLYQGWERIMKRASEEMEQEENEI